MQAAVSSKLAGGRIHSPQRPKPSLLDPSYFMHAKQGRHAKSAKARHAQPEAIHLFDRGGMPTDANKPQWDTVDVGDLDLEAHRLTLRLD